MTDESAELLADALGPGAGRLARRVHHDAEHVVEPMYRTLPGPRREHDLAAFDGPSDLLNAPVVETGTGRRPVEDGPPLIGWSEPTALAGGRLATAGRARGGGWHASTVAAGCPDATPPSSPDDLELRGCGGMEVSIPFPQEGSKRRSINGAHLWSPQIHSTCRATFQGPVEGCRALRCSLRRSYPTPPDRAIR